MRTRERKRVDWDEELRKTERIRRRGLFISALGLGVAAIFIVGVSRMNNVQIELGRKIIFTFCFVVAMFLVRVVLRRRARLKEEQEEREVREYEMRLRAMELEVGAAKGDFKEDSPLAGVSSLEAREPEKREKTEGRSDGRRDA